MNTALDPIRKARTSLVLKSPFFGTLALRLQLREDPTCETVWTDGRELGANPEFLKKTSQDVLEGILCHEVMHLAMGHHVRRKGRDRNLWNQAADLAINPVVEEAGFTLPADRLRESSYDHLEAEAIYAALSRERGKDQKRTTPKDRGQARSEKQNRHDKNAQTRPDQEKGQGRDPGGCGEIRDFPARDEQDLKDQQDEWTTALREAAVASQSWGKVPGKLRRLLRRFGTSRVDWRESLRRFVEETSRNDYSWKYPNRRYLPQGLYLPVLEKKEFGRIVLMVDTSASLNRDQLSDLAWECLSILELYEDDASITVLYVDSRLAGIQELTRETRPLPMGGGGTSYRPGFAWLEEQEWSPAAVVYFTDGHCADFPNEPDVPVLWVLSSENRWFEQRTPFGEVVLLEE